jgi:hypothetical protein
MKQVGRGSEAAPAPGSILQADSLRLLDLAGEPFDLRRSSEGRAHVVIFTRSDCSISNGFAPEVREMCQTLHPQGVDFYLIYVDPNQKPDAIRQHLKQYDYPCPALRDPQHTLVAQTGATVTPEAVVFDNEWRIIYRGRICDQIAEAGESQTSSAKHDLRNAIEATLAGKPIAKSVTRAIGCYISQLK